MSCANSLGVGKKEGGREGRKGKKGVEEESGRNSDMS